MTTKKLPMTVEVEATLNNASSINCLRARLRANGLCSVLCAVVLDFWQSNLCGTTPVLTLIGPDPVSLKRM